MGKSTGAMAPTVDGRTVWRRVLRDASVAGAWIAALLTLGIAVVAVHSGADAVGYWRSWHGDPYTQVPYPPPALLLFVPASVLPLPVFVLLWRGVLVLAAGWLVWPLPVRIRVPIFLAFAATAAWSNVALLLAVAVALAPRYPIAWAVVGWIKVTPAVGAVSLVRERRWRDVAWIVVPSLALWVVLLATLPGSVAAWWNALHMASDVANTFMPNMLPFTVSLPVRLPIAAAIAWFGARRPWTLAVATFLATPDVSLATCGMLAAIPRLLKAEAPARLGRGSGLVGPSKGGGH